MMNNVPQQKYLEHCYHDLALAEKELAEAKEKKSEYWQNEFQYRIAEVKRIIKKVEERGLNDEQCTLWR